MKPLLFILTLLIGLSGLSQAFAADYYQETDAYVRFLNEVEPGLQLHVQKHSYQALQELEILDLELERAKQNPNGGFQIPDRSLELLSCSKIVCGGGGGCTTCFQGYNSPHK